MRAKKKPSFLLIFLFVLFKLHFYDCQQIGLLVDSGWLMLNNIIKTEFENVSLLTVDLNTKGVGSILLIQPCSKIMQLKTSLNTKIINLNADECPENVQNIKMFSSSIFAVQDLLSHLQVSNIILSFDSKVLTNKEINKLLSNLHRNFISAFVINEEKDLCKRHSTNIFSCYDKEWSRFSGVLVQLGLNRRNYSKNRKEWSNIKYSIALSKSSIYEADELLFDSKFLYLITRNVKRFRSTIKNFSTSSLDTLKNETINELREEPDFVLIKKSIKEVWKKSQEIGSWSKNSKLKIDERKIKNYKNFANFNGIVLNVISVTRSPSQILEPLDDNTFNATGPIFDAVKTMAKVYNFRYRVYSPEDNNFGGINKSGNFSSWNGMIGMLINESLQMDFAAALFTVTNERREVIDFSAPYLTQGYGILMKSEDKRQISNAIIAPFSRIVWFFMILSIASMGPTIFLFIKFQKLIFKKAEQDKYSIGDCCWFVFGAMCKQGTSMKPQLDSIRILFAFWWIFCLMANSFYSANLTAYLTVNDDSQKINDIFDVIKQTSITWIVKAGDAIDDKIQRGETSPFIELKKSFHEGRGIIVHSDEKAINKVISGNHVYFREKSTLDNLRQAYYKKTGKCDLVVAEKQFLTRDFAFAFPKNSPYKATLDIFVKRGRESGLIGFMIKSDGRQDPCNFLGQSSSILAKTLDLYDMMITFAGLLFGLILSVFIIIVEKLWKKWKNEQIHKNQVHALNSLT